MSNQNMATANQVLAELVEEAKQAFGDDLGAVILFGSAAEGRLRPTSDVNLLLLLEHFDAARVDAFRSPLRTAHASIQAQVMFLLRSELPLATELFAVKFNDIANRHQVLHGEDPFVNFRVSSAALVQRLREVLLNLAIRLRERYALVSLREEQLIREISACAGPLRSAAFSLLQLEGCAAESPRAALEQIASTYDEKLSQAVAMLPLARQQLALPPGAAGPTLLALSRLASHLGQRLEQRGSK